MRGVETHGVATHLFEARGAETHGVETHSVEPTALLHLRPVVLKLVALQPVAF